MEISSICAAMHGHMTLPIQVSTATYVPRLLHITVAGANTKVLVESVARNSSPQHDEMYSIGEVAVVK